MSSGPATFRSPWDANRITAVTGLALLLPAGAAVLERGQQILMPLALALGVVVFWTMLFSRLRDRPVGWDGLVPGIVFVLLAPSQTAVWQQGMALSFGLVFGGLIFGARGHGFLNPAAVGLAFLSFSFPDVPAADGSGPLAAVAAAVAGAVLLAAGLLSWRIVLGFAATLSAAIVLSPTPTDPTELPIAALVLVLVFLVGDPVAASCTNSGRWIYGAMAGSLSVILGFAEGASGAPDPIIFAALLASLLAPLIDQIVIAGNVAARRRRKRNG